MTHEFPFLSLLLITGLAATVPLLASRLRRFDIPIVVLEILVGIVIGKSGLDLIEPSPALEFLAAFGFTFLMFLSGLEVDFAALMSSARAPTDRRLGDPAGEEFFELLHQRPEVAEVDDDLLQLRHGDAFRPGRDRRPGKLSQRRVGHLGAVVVDLLHALLLADCADVPADEGGHHVRLLRGPVQ